MSKGSFALLAGLALLASGCVVRTYPLTRDRVDQDVSSSSGNHGYLMGSGPVGGVEKDRPTTRTTQVLEIELHSPIQFDKKRPKPVKEEEATGATLTTTQAQADTGSAYNYGTGLAEETEPVPAVSTSYQKYTVQKGDTLQKISTKFYGTSKKWTKIFGANKSKLGSPDKLRPGQTLDIPDVSGSASGIMEPAENLK